MTTRIRYGFVLLAACVAAACSSTAGTDVIDPIDGVTHTDGGSTGPSGGNNGGGNNGGGNNGGGNNGGGNSGEDSGTGSTGDDSGGGNNGGEDGGTVAKDSGSGSDAGSTHPDSGTAHDAGTVADAGGSTGVFAGTPPYVSKSGGNGHHNAGRNCFQCHGQNAVSFSIAGTIYNANGQPLSNVEVRVVDSTGAAYSVYSGTNGNFYRQGNPLSVTSHVGIRNATATTEMVSSITSGACNSCHCTGNGCASTPIHLP